MRRLLLVLPLMAACGANEPEQPAIEPKLSALEERIFGPTCATASCHSTGNAANSGQLDLSAGHAYASLVNIAAKNAGAVDEGLLLVNPGKPSNSFLLKKVQTNVPVAYGTRMPQAAAPLTDAERAAIEQWITRGAPND